MTASEHEATIRDAQAFIAQVHRLRETEASCDELDDRIGARHFRDEAERGLGHWFADHGPVLLAALDALEAERDRAQAEEARWRSACVSDSFKRSQAAYDEMVALLARKDEALMELLAWLGQGRASRDDEAARKIAREALAGRGQA